MRPAVCCHTRSLIFQAVRSDEFYADNPLWYRAFYMVPMFLVFRTRLYIAWILSECVCIASTLGAYPAASVPRCTAGPTDFKALEQWYDLNCVI